MALFPDYKFGTTAARIAYAFVANDIGKSVQDLEDGKIYTVIREGTGEDSMACQSTGSRYGYIPLPMNAWTEADATALAAFVSGASPTPGFAVDGSEAAGVRWNNHANPDPISTSFVVPPDLDPNEDIEVHIIAHKTGATVGDAVTYDVGAFFNVVGALYDADANAGETSSAMTGDAATKTVQKVTATIDAADLPDPQSAMSTCTLTLQPTDGTLGTDDVTVTGVYCTYTRRDFNSVA